MCHNVATEPNPDPLEGEQFCSAATATVNGARLDIAASGFWGGRFERTFFDVQVFNPNVQSNVLFSPPSLGRRHERQKQKYEQRNSRCGAIYVLPTDLVDVGRCRTSSNAVLETPGRQAERKV